METQVRKRGTERKRGKQKTDRREREFHKHEGMRERKRSKANKGKREDEMERKG